MRSLFASIIAALGGLSACLGSPGEPGPAGPRGPGGLTGPDSDSAEVSGSVSTATGAAGEGRSLDDFDVVAIGASGSP
ncbi:MAG: hypothetical protein KTR31_25350 [Myxococcales bacterium]|nr:hypothetical protein [Myxococcales bacterium]